MGPDLARPGFLLVHCAGVMGLGFAAVVTSDRDTEAVAGPTAAASA